MTYHIEIGQLKQFFKDKKSARTAIWAELELIEDPLLRYAGIPILLDDGEEVERCRMVEKYRVVSSVKNGLCLTKSMDPDGVERTIAITDCPISLEPLYTISSHTKSTCFVRLENARKGCLYLIREAGRNNSALKITGPDDYSEFCGLINGMPMVKIGDETYKISNEGRISKAKTYRASVSVCN